MIYVDFGRSTRSKFEKVNKEELYKPIVKKVVIMVIDALRWDFVTGPIGEVAMPTVDKLLKNDLACLQESTVNIPTVTMPKIREMMTGMMSSFVDVILNLGGQAVTSDSFILQAKYHNHKLVFYGDDTWIKLFPDSFHRSDGTTSFFVNDFTEVDNNVTRHIYRELHNDDWSVLILHYLGVDHIGHIGGPRHSKMIPKLREMDSIIGTIKEQIFDWNAKGISSLLLICADHGMKDSGGHGGATLEETRVPLVTVGIGCPQEKLLNPKTGVREPPQIAQVDFAATLSVLLGVPIPSTNLGRISLNLLGNLSTSRQLFLLNYNSKQLLRHFETLPEYKSQYGYIKYIEAERLHGSWLRSSQEWPEEDVSKTRQAYLSALKAMRETLASDIIDYDLHTIILASIVLCKILYVLLNETEDSEPLPKGSRIIYTLVIDLSICWIIDQRKFPFNKEREDFGVKKIGSSGLLTIMALVAIFLSSWLFATIKHAIISLWTIDAKRMSKFEFWQWLFPLASLGHALSLSSSSFVEEEHQTWYFFWTTLLVTLLINNIGVLFPRRRPIFEQESGNPKLKETAGLVTVLLVHRFLRNLNSTGNKFANLPDIADWLQEHEETHFTMTILLLAALLSLVWIGSMCRPKRDRQSLFLHIALAICIYLRHAVDETVTRIPFYPFSRGIYEVRAFWLLLVVSCLKLTWNVTTLFIHKRRTARNDGSENKSALLISTFMLETWVAVSAMLHRPHNVCLLPIQIIVSSVMKNTVKPSDRRNTIIAQIFVWLGNVFYFYQGNSNSLATIDIAAGYVGLESYRPVFIAALITINTYSAPVLAYLTLIHWVTQETSKVLSRTMWTIARNLIVCRLLPTAVYTIVVVIQRHHLFVWSVFSPKLLYEAMHCAVIYLTVLTVSTIFLFHDYVVNKKLK
ncbi:GPI ethanolamine phosphate transferase 2 isoform X2 [Orussus abietinus]|uniref:GPI ethanolamine phosphate transferase 2 isoform X2 n=1 Tax=Orussus abietinus TaxID=222816 RepID=UPI00062574B7|nr:GPI ethanolamine phosphate transferase 2 isoform X2 [Orussus abietinus]